MIKLITNGDIFQSNCQTITNTINVKGVAGAGLALEFKKRYPEYYIRYRELCNQSKIKLGYPVLHKQFTETKQECPFPLGEG